jgi:hypothetical protein
MFEQQKRRWAKREDLPTTLYADRSASGFVDLQPGNRTIRDARIIIDKSHGTQDSAHAKCCNQLIAGNACTVDGDFGEAIIRLANGTCCAAVNESPMKY